MHVAGRDVGVMKGGGTAGLQVIEGRGVVIVDIPLYVVRPDPPAILLLDRLLVIRCCRHIGASVLVDDTQLL